MTLDELREEWDKDTQISDDLGKAAISCSLLHSKYINELINAKLRLTKIEHEISELKARKAKYFRGEMTKPELDELGWTQWQYKSLRGDIPEMIEADSDMQKYLTRSSYMKTTIYFLESVLGEIKNRNFSIRAAIDWHKFRAGI